VIVLVGDIGGTNSRLALYDAGAPVFERVYPSADHPSLDAVAERFLEDARKGLASEVRPQRACLAVAGPVEDETSRTTNLPWFIDARKLEQHLRIPRVTLVNDFQAAAMGVMLLGDEHLVRLGGGARVPKGPIAVLGAGTGLGEGFLVWSQGESRYQVIASEGGHVDFAPRTGLESALLSYLVGRYGRVSYERVLSGAGLADIFAFLMTEPACRPLVTEETRAALVGDDPAAVVSRQALAGRDPVCAMALNLFSSILGGHAGNLALALLSTGGVFIAGGIAPKVLPALQGGTFREGFEAKGRFQPLAARIPVFVVMHKDVGLVGAAEFAARL
jgi:glucokinase